VVAIGRQWPELLGGTGAATLVGGGSVPFLLGPYLVPILRRKPAEYRVVTNLLSVGKQARAGSRADCRSSSRATASALARSRVCFGHQRASNYEAGGPAPRSEAEVGERAVAVARARTPPDGRSSRCRSRPSGASVIEKPAGRRRRLR